MTMFTAKDMQNKLKVLEECSGIDEWIRDVLYRKFLQYGSRAIIYTSDITRQGWIPKGFISAMNVRGFHVDFTSEQRDGDFYTITFPPQER